MFDNKNIQKLAQHDTPLYFYDTKLLRQTLEACKSAANIYGFHVHYAMKANFNSQLLQTIQAFGFGADCVSGNEVKCALQHGFDASKTVYAGVGKTDKEIEIALDNGIFCFNVESIQELEVIEELAQKKNKIAQVAIRINPNVDAYTHKNITTGLEENKFGINVWELPQCTETLRKLKYVKFVGIHFHVGSQITNMNVFKSLCIRVNEFNTWFEERGFEIKILNVGGGLGINYHAPDQDIADFEQYFSIFNEFLHVKNGQEVHFELGRVLVAQCSSLISRVLYVKNGKKKNFIILDAGMTILMRPALYQAYHKIENLSKFEYPDSIKYDVVGPICESTDCFGKEVFLPETVRGDLIAIRSAGAYGEVMASNYNLKGDFGSVLDTDLIDIYEN